MTAREIILKIISKFDRSGTRDAAAEVENLGNAADKAGKKSEDAAKGTAKLSQASGRAATMVGSLSNAMGAGGPQAQKLGAGLRVLQTIIAGSSAGFMGLATVLVGAGVSAWMAYQRKVEESKKKLAEFARQVEENKRVQDAASVEKLAGQYDILRKSIDDASTAQNRLNQAYAAADSAEKASRLADITLREKLALESLSEDDQSGAARIAAQFAQERSALEDEYRTRAADRDAESSARALSDAEEKLRITGMDIENARVKIKDFEKAIANTNEELSALQGTPMKRIMVGAGFGGNIAYMDVVDEERKTKMAEERAKLQARLNGTEGGAPGLEANYRESAAALSAALARQEREAVEVKARRTEAGAAATVQQTAAVTLPAASAVDTRVANEKVLQEHIRALEDSLQHVNESLYRSIVLAFEGMIRNGTLTAENVKALTRKVDDLTPQNRLH